MQLHANGYLRGKATLESRMGPSQWIPESAEVVSHDWMAYLLISGSGGQVFYDPEPTVDYRQHGANLIGSNSSLCDRLVRLRKMLHGTFRKWNDLNIGVLAMFRERLSADSMNALIVS